MGDGLEHITWRAIFTGNGAVQNPEEETGTL
jgi:hypothetical protein